MCSKARAKGFTLAELLLLIVVFGMFLAAILGVYSMTVSRSADPMVRKQAMAIAESLMEEILLMPFDQQGWSGAATQANRANFDDVRDYCPPPYNSANCFQTNGVFTVTGNAIPALAAYNVSVAVAPVNVAPVTGNVLEVKVTVNGPFNTTYVLTGHKVNY